MTTRLPRQKLIPLIIACALFMENLDSTVIGTSLPQIARSFGTDPLHLSLAITSYLLSLAVFIPASGWVADRFGAKNVFRAAIVVFTLGSILCGLSNSTVELVGARIIQGMGGAMMVPVGRLVLLRSVSKAELVRAMAYLTTPALLGPVLGPPLGGFITTYSSWRLIFFINVPIGIIGVILVTLFIDDVREEERTPFDVRGLLMSGVALGCLVFGFETLGRSIVPLPVTGVLFVIGLASLWLYIRHAHRVPAPILDLTLLHVRTFRISVVGGTVFRVGIGAIPFLLPLMLQLGFGMTPFESGMLTFISAAGALLMKMTATRIIRHFGFRPVLVWNAVISAVFLMSYALFRADTPHLLIMALLLAGGYFRSLQFTSLNTLAFADIAPQKMSRASSFSSTAQQLSASLGVATGAVLLNLTLMLHGGSELQATDFSWAFFAVGLLSLSSVLMFLRLAPDAGAEVSGHAVAPVAPPEPAAPRPAPGE
ncbi:DHA2 family efflux MFS transporter permease subunit [Inquilinus sp.]|jgi:EmrB/QacA subfamily drug resistance transporter|uniref:DHA2 family efflux MFS transporter permease subunit n=1 Tax=Inquilinus sp. TaxID=1932117 RepID=UPI003782E8DE